MRRRFWIYALPILLLLVVTLPHLEQGDLRVETAHYAAIGVQSWRDPGLFWTPHEHPSVPYFNKPPLVFWIHGLVLHVFGIGLIAARLPSILAAIGCVVLTTVITRRLSGRLVAITSGCILALTYEFFRRTRDISPDLWQLFFMLAAVAIWVAARHSQHPWRAWLAGFPLGLALLCKPLMALLLVPILCLWALIDHPRRRDMAILLALTGTAVLTALPWHAYMIHLHGDAFTNQYFGREVAARLQGLRNREPAWYYLVEIGRSYWPWMLALSAGLFRWVKGPNSQRHRNVLLMAAAWITVWGVSLSCFPDKRPRYELPLYPLMALLAGVGLSTLPWKPLRRWYRHGLAVTALGAVLVALIIHLLPIRFQAPPNPDLTALVEWACGQDPGRVYSAALSSIDESTLYLKAGYWPTPLRLAPHPLRSGSALIYTDGLSPHPPASAVPVFTRGPYHVLNSE